MRGVEGLVGHPGHLVGDRTLVGLHEPHSAEVVDVLDRPLLVGQGLGRDGVLGQAMSDALVVLHGDLLGVGQGVGPGLEPGTSRSERR